MLFQKFKKTFHQNVLDFLWDQWSTLGVAGHYESHSNRIIDPEALLLFSMTIARHDMRLFDEVIDWLNVNSSSICVNRLKNIMKTDLFEGQRQIQALASILSQQSENSKWKKLATPYKGKKSSHLFFDQDGKAMKSWKKNADHDETFMKWGFIRPLIKSRGHSRKFPAEKPSCLLLKLRSLMGVTSRCDIIAYLSDGKKDSTANISDKTYFTQNNVRDNLNEMCDSNFVKMLGEGKEKHYRLNPDEWGEILPHKKSEWFDWVNVLSAIEKIWLVVNEAGSKNNDKLLLASNMKLLSLEIDTQLENLNSQLSLPRIEISEKKYLKSIFKYFSEVTDLACQP